MLRLLAVALALALSLSAPSGAASDPPAERFTAYAVSMSNGSAGRSSNLELVVDRWSTSAERDDLAAALDEMGPAGLFKRVQRLPRIGFVRAAGRLGTDVALARQVQHSDGTRRVVMVLPRRLAFGEITRGSTSEDYAYTVIELHVDASGVGDGKMWVGSTIKVHKGSDQIDHEDYVGGSVLLKDVQAFKVLRSF